MKQKRFVYSLHQVEMVVNTTEKNSSPLSECNTDQIKNVKATQKFLKNLKLL